MVGSTHKDECEIDGCGGSEELLHCGGCNISFHPQCMIIHWGLDVRRKPAPWCSDCFDEWEEGKGMEVATSSARSGTKVNYNPAHRTSGPAAGACPIAAATRGRRRVRLTRAGPQAASNIAFLPCVLGKHPPAPDPNPNPMPNPDPNPHLLPYPHQARNVAMSVIVWSLVNDRQLETNTTNSDAILSQVTFANPKP
jgi:hypothetical protein